MQYISILHQKLLESVQIPPNHTWGLQVGSVKRKVVKSISIAKNYLQEGEITALNKLVNMFLDYAERMAEKRTGSYKMEDWAKRLDMFLNFNEYPILENSGKVSHEVAKRFAETEYSKFRVIQDREYKSDFNKLIDASINGLPKEEDIDNGKAKDNENENNVKNEDFYPFTFLPLKDSSP